MSVMHSIVLALGIARVLGGIADVARDWHVLGAKWFFLGWLALLLVAHLGWWFGLWVRFGAMSEIGILTFMAWFVVPASFYVASRLLVPEFPEGSPPDLEQHFSKVRVPFFGCLVLAIVPALPGLGVADRSQWLLPVFGALALTGMLVPDRRWHIFLLWSMLTTYLIFLAFARSVLSG